MRSVPMILAVLLIVVGTVWSFQGAGYLGGSFMTGERQWLVIGIVCIVIGAGLLLFRLRATGRDR